MTAGGSLGVQIAQSHGKGAPSSPPTAISQSLPKAQSFRQRWQALVVSLEPASQAESREPEKMLSPASSEPTTCASAKQNRKLSAAFPPTPKQDYADRILPIDSKLLHVSRTADPAQTILFARQPIADTSGTSSTRRDAEIRVSKEKDHSTPSDASNAPKPNGTANSIAHAAAILTLPLVPSAVPPAAVPVCDSENTKCVSASRASFAEQPYPGSTQPTATFAGNPVLPVTGNAISRHSVNSNSRDFVVSLNPSSSHEFESFAPDRSYSSLIPGSDLDEPDKTPSSSSIPAVSKSPQPEVPDAPQPRIVQSRESLIYPAASIHQQNTTPIASPPGPPHAGLQELEPVRSSKATPGITARTASVEKRATHSGESSSFAIAPAHAQASAAAPPPASTHVPGFSNSREPGPIASHSQNLVREPFTTIDAGMADTPPRWVHAGQHQAETGFEDPSLGWVSVRAQTDAHGVHASLIPSSPDAAQVLDSHLASLNAHVATEYPKLNPVTISSPQTNWHGHTSGQDPNQNDRPGTNNGNQHQREDHMPIRKEDDLIHQTHRIANTSVLDPPLTALRSPGGHQVWVVA
jgi:hypothetical protein